MKKFILGALASALVFSLSISALAISGRMTIEIDPINIQVNGVTFKPTDANGNEVPVFAYNGTTYAPLRALAEAYGLEVGYDSAANMATVGVRESAPTKLTGMTYEEFKGLWTLSDENTDGYLPHLYYMYSGHLSKQDLCSSLNTIGKEVATEYCEQMISEWSEKHSLPFGADMRFFYSEEEENKYDHGDDSGLLIFVESANGLGSGYCVWNVIQPTQH